MEDKKLIQVRLVAKPSCKHCYGRGYDYLIQGKRHPCRCLRPLSQEDRDNMKIVGEKNFIIYTEAEIHGGEGKADTHH